MTIAEVEFIDADTAIDAVRRCAHETGEVDPDGCNPRRVVHCFSGGIGADWDEPAVIDAIRRAHVHNDVPQIAWVDTMLGRCLVVIESEGPDGGRRRIFDTVTPPTEEPTP